MEPTVENVWLARMSAAQDFHVFEDYLGLNHLVKNLRLNVHNDRVPEMISSGFDLNDLDYDSSALSVASSSSRSRSSSASDGTYGSSPTSWDDFHLNGVEIDVAPEGFQPFQPTTALRKISIRPGSKNRRGRTPTWCVFCKNNQEDERLYGGHVLKDNEGRTTCPILRNYTCPICGACGDTAHTIKYCPLNKDESLIESCSEPTATSASAPGFLNNTSRLATSMTSKKRPPSSLYPSLSSRV